MLDLRYYKSHTFDDRVWTFLKEQPWPGNVRQLAHAIERLVLIVKNQTIQVTDVLRVMPRDIVAEERGNPYEAGQLKDLTYEMIKKMSHEGKSGAAIAKELGISRSTVYRIKRKHEEKGADDMLNVRLAKDVTGLNSVTTGGTTMNDKGITIKTGDANRTITVQDGNVNMGGNKAGAAALAALHPLDFDPDDKWDFAAGYGNYKDASAVAVGAYYRPNEDTMFNIGGSFGGGENMVNAGVSFKVGQGNHVSTSRVAMAKEIKDLRQNVANLNAIVNRQSALIDKLTGTNVGMIKDKGNDLFPDVPANHWAYEYVTKLKQAGILTGYPDGNFDGNRMMTRYEFAAIVYRAIMAGAASNPALNQDGTLDKLANEFSSEMKYIRIDTIAKDKNGKPTIERVRVIPDTQHDAQS
ncbi:YadA-like family protein [uncultured Megasphaera sp.]|uniref:YadA-like family protein n=1 Tax=Megasphaera elsdenii TaxID=907 RepID=UPI0035A671E5